MRKKNLTKLFDCENSENKLIFKLIIYQLKIKTYRWNWTTEIKF